MANVNHPIIIIDDDDDDDDNNDKKNNDDDDDDGDDCIICYTNNEKIITNNNAHNEDNNIRSTTSNTNDNNITSNNNNNEKATPNQNNRPSQKWNDTIQQCKELNVLFIDDSFPPNSTSVDGRKIHYHNNHSNTKMNTKRNANQHESNESCSSSPLSTRQEVIKCRCGVPATIKTVQKDGPNYGRFFLSCGNGNKYNKARRKINDKNNKKRRKVINNNNNDKENEIIILDSDDDENDNEKIMIKDDEKNQSTKPKTCSFFQWDDNHEQTNLSTSSRSAWMQQLLWFRYDNSNHGYNLTHPKGKFSPNHVKQGAMGDCWFLSALVCIYYYFSLILFFF